MRARLRALAGHPATATATVVGALAAVHLALAMYFWLPAPSAATLLAPTWELAGLVAAVLVVAARPWRPAAARAIRAGLTAVVLAYALLGFAQGFARREFGYDVALAIDLKYVPVLLGMMQRTETIAWFVLDLAVIAAALVATVALLYLAIARLARAAAGNPARHRLAVGVIAYLAVMAAVTGLAGPLTSVVVDEIDLAIHKEERLAALGRRLEGEAAKFRQRAPLVVGDVRPDILVMVVESYGAALLLDPGFADFQALLDDEQRGLTAAGYHMRSRYFASPVFGGSSWMADASLLCGVRLFNQKRYASLYSSAIRCLPAELEDAGYHSVLAAGNTTFVDDEFLRRFPFDQLYLSESFGYAGPRYSWSYIPDQFVIDTIDRREIAPPRSEPLFVFYMLTSSHHPWRRVPPYVADWQQLGDGTVYRSRPAQIFAGNRFASGSHYRDGFEASIRYSLRVVFDYLASLPAERSPLVIVLGDHQPRQPVAQRGADPWWVPIHIMSRDPALVERFAGLGYVPGIVPAADGAGAPIVGLERFIDDLGRALR